MGRRPRGDNVGLCVAGPKDEDTANYIHCSCTASETYHSIRRRITYIRPHCELHVTHNFIVVEQLVAPVILGVDFLHQYSLVLDFSTTIVTVRISTTAKPIPVRPIYEAAWKIDSKMGAIHCKKIICFCHSLH